MRPRFLFLDTRYQHPTNPNGSTHSRPGGRVRVNKILCYCRENLTLQNACSRDSIRSSTDNVRSMRQKPSKKGSLTKIPPLQTQSTIPLPAFAGVTSITPFTANFLTRELDYLINLPVPSSRNRTECPCVEITRIYAFLISRTTCSLNCGSGNICNNNQNKIATI